MLLKVERYGRLENLLFRCPVCNRYFSQNLELPKEAWLRQKLLKMMNIAGVCDACVKTSKETRS